MRVLTAREQVEMLSPWRTAMPWHFAAFVAGPNEIHRTVGWDIPQVWRMRGHTPESVAQRLADDPKGTVNDVFSSIEDNFGGVGHHWTRNPEVAHKIADTTDDLHDFHVVFSGTHDPEDVNHADEQDSRGGDWPEEEETTLYSGAPVHIHQMKIRPQGNPNWTTVPMDHDAFTSWGDA